MADMLNRPTRRVVATFTESWDFIQETKRNRRKPLGRKYAAGEEALEKALQETADELTALFCDCLGYSEAFMTFDGENTARLRT